MGVWSTVSSMFVYSTQKYLKIHDLRLGIIFRLLQIGMLFYTIYDIVANKTYLSKESPTGSVFTHINPGMYNQLQEEFIGDKYNPAYCNHQYEDPDDGKMFQPTCVATDMGRVTSSNSKESAVVSYMKQTTYETVDCGICELNGCENVTNNHCRMKQLDNFLMVGVENLNYTFSHKIQTTKMTASSDGRDGTKMVTIIKDQNNNQAEIFASGQEISLPLTRWLELAGVKSLDDPNPNMNNISYRVTGITLQVTLEYDNSNDLGIDLDNWQSSVISVDDFQCEVKVKVDTVATSLGNEVFDLSNPKVVSKKYLTSDFIQKETRGISFSFVPTGMVSEFSYSYLISAITNGLVLLNFAYTITTFIAWYLLGADSTLYKRYGYQDTNLKQELAQFTLQAALNAQIYKVIDKNGDHVLSKQEIRELLERAFGKKGEGQGIREEGEESFTPKEIDNLVKNILKHATGNADATCLTYAQFIDIVTECDELDIDTLKERSQKKKFWKTLFCCKKQDDEDDGDDWTNSVLHSDSGIPGFMRQTYGGEKGKGKKFRGKRKSGHQNSNGGVPPVAPSPSGGGTPAYLQQQSSFRQKQASQHLSTPHITIEMANRNLSNNHISIQQTGQPAYAQQQQKVHNSPAPTPQYSSAQGQPAIYQQSQYPS